jgi:hypothetical protein
MGRALPLLLAAFLSASGADIPPTGKPSRLFNGKNLSGFDIWLEGKGLNNDPGRVFQVTNGVIHISGSEQGYLITKKSYGDYYLKCEFKWGEKTQTSTSDSGILLHVTGPNAATPRSLEYQFSGGGTGDLVLLNGAELTVKGERKSSGQFDRFGKGRTPNGEVENPPGEWNLVEVVAEGDLVRYWLNGRLVNEGSDASIRKGKIAFRSEGAEVLFRNIGISKITK